MADMPDLNCEDFFNQKEEEEASMNEEVPVETVATGSEEPEIAAPEMAASTAKDEKPEIEADPPGNTRIFQDLVNDSAPPPAKRAKRREPKDKEPEPNTEVPADLGNDVDRPQT